MGVGEKSHAERKVVRVADPSLSKPKTVYLRLGDWLDTTTLDQIKEWSRNSPSAARALRNSARVIAALMLTGATFVSEAVRSPGGDETVESQQIALDADRTAAPSASRSSLFVVTPQPVSLSPSPEAAQVTETTAPPPEPPAPPPTEAPKAPLITPVSGVQVSSVFGNRVHPVTGASRLHAGIDYPVKTGTPIRAAASGTVTKAGLTSGYGYYTCIEHDSGLSTCYAHQSKISVSRGQGVSQGETIGLSGNTGLSTGAHLHFEVRKGDTPVNPSRFL